MKYYLITYQFRVDANRVKQGNSFIKGSPAEWLRKKNTEDYNICTKDQCPTSDIVLLFAIEITREEYAGGEIVYHDALVD